jgi:hypothetical protein
MAAVTGRNDLDIKITKTQDLQPWSENHFLKRLLNTIKQF